MPTGQSVYQRPNRRRESMTLNVKGEGLGAQVTGLDPANLDDISTDELREIVYTNKLVILKDVHPSPEQFIKLGKLVGEIVPYYEPLYHHQDHPEIFVSSTEQGQGVPKTGAFWHIDYMFMPEPFAFSMVLPLTVPGPTAEPTSSTSPRFGSRCRPLSRTRSAGHSAPTTLGVTSRFAQATSTSPSAKSGTRSTAPPRRFSGQR